MVDIAIQNINWLTIPAGAVLYMLVGGLWYGPVAGKAWMAEMGMTEDELRAAGNPAAAMGKSFIAAFFLSAGLAFILAMPAFRDSGWQGGMMTGFIIAVLIIGGGTFPNYAFENKTLRHFLIHMGCVIIAMMLMGAMMGVWR
ncbi:MAG: hypothetical protein COB37_01120 [Kordiimonadales bacterium]|nr:MAG: hypothetical protein COB37_01120 [Kordiimonadales bacterium]